MKTKRVIAFMLALMMTAVLLPGAVFAEIYENGSCPHHQNHTEECGFSKNFQCAYVCYECIREVQSLIDKLPEMKAISMMTEAEKEAVMEKLDEIDKAKLNLTDAALYEVNWRKYEGASFVLTIPDGYFGGYAVKRDSVSVADSPKSAPKFAFVNENGSYAKYISEDLCSEDEFLSLTPNGDGGYFYLPQGTYTVEEFVDGNWTLTMEVDGVPSEDLSLTGQSGEFKNIMLCNAPHDSFFRLTLPSGTEQYWDTPDGVCLNLMADGEMGTVTVLKDYEGDFDFTEGSYVNFEMEENVTLNGTFKAYQNTWVKFISGRFKKVDISLTDLTILDCLCDGTAFYDENGNVLNGNGQVLSGNPIEVRTHQCTFDTNGDCLCGREKEDTPRTVNLGTSGILGKQRSYIYLGKYPQSGLGSTPPEDGAEGVDYVKKESASWNGVGPYYKLEPIKWRVLSNGSTGIYMVSDKNLDNAVLSSNSDQVSARQSAPNLWLGNDFYNAAFSEIEKRTFLPIDKTISGERLYRSIFLLTTDDACRVDYGFEPLMDMGAKSRQTVNTDYVYGGGKEGTSINMPYSGTTSSYWLWGQNESGQNYYLRSYGIIQTESAKTALPIRPTVNILQDIAFTTAIGAKKAEIGLNAVEDNSGNEYKITVKKGYGPQEPLFSVNETELESAGGQSVTVNYANAQTGTNEYISAMIVKDGEVLYYGKIASVADSSGSATFTLPEGIAVGNYTLNIFNEQINGEYETDSSSNFAAVTLKIKRAQNMSVFTFIPAPSLVYDGESKKGIWYIDGFGFGASIKYKDSNNVVTDNPIEAGDYTVLLNVSGTDTYLPVVDYPLATFTISQATPNAADEVSAKVKKGKTLGEAELSGGNFTGVNGEELTGTLAWANPDEEIRKACQRDMIFTPDNQNYCEKTISVKVETYGGSSASTAEGNDSCTVKFESNGGGKVSSQTLNYGEKAKEPQTPQKEGYTFDGWYKDKGLAIKYDFSQKVTQNLILYGKWEKAQQTEPDDTPNGIQSDNQDKWKNPFKDVKESDWFFESVRAAVLNCIMNGTSEEEFSPSLPVTRGMLVTILYRLSGEPAVNKSIPFKDVKEGSYYRNAIIWAEQTGIISGISETEFAPDENITREQIAVILYRYAKVTGNAPQGAWAIKLDYEDINEISDYAAEGVMYCTLKGIMQGKDGNRFAPQEAALRSELAAVLQRLEELN